MDDFSRLLAYFADPKVEALILQSERAIAVRINGEIAALTPSALPDSQLRQLLYTSPLAPQMDALGNSPIQVPLRSPQGQDLIATLSPHREGLHCSLARSSDRRTARMSIPPNPPTLPTTQRSETTIVRRPSVVPNPGQRAARGPSVPPTAGQPRESGGPSPAKKTGSARKSPKPRSARSTQAGPLGSYLALSRREGASDIHIVSNSAILLRRMGKLQRHGEAIPNNQVEAMIHNMLEPQDRAQLDDKGYADFALEDEQHGRFRVNVCRHKRGLKACFRVLPPHPPSLDELGLPTELAQVLKHHQGLAIIAGPNGQGKSTTLAALVNKLNEEKAIHIITVEDPIEVVHPIKKAVMSQRQVGRDTKSFHSALKGALREDPDVIVLGELRDRETVEMALSAAETGHLVIATMNTPSGAKTIGRLIDLFPPDDQAQVRATLAGTLMIVAAQRLVPRADGSEMVAAVELITGGVPLWSLIRDNKLVQLPGLMQRGKRMGMIRLEDSLRTLLEQGVIDQTTFDYYVRLESGPQAQTESPARPAAPSQPDTPSNAANPGLRSLFRRKNAS